MRERFSFVAVALAVLVVRYSPADDAKPDKAAVATIELQYASAVQIAAAFGAKQEAGDQETSAADQRRDFVRRALADATQGVRPLPQIMQEPGLYPFEERRYAEVRVAQAPPGTAAGGGGGFAGLLPEGITEPPTAVPNQNALLVKGTPKAIDEFREIISLLDKPPKQVNIEVKLVNIVHLLNEEWGLDFAARGPESDAFLQGPASAGPSVRVLSDDVSALLARNRSTSLANSTTGASVTTQSNRFCAIRALTVIPVVIASATIDAFGQRHVDYRVDAIAIGVELFVLPRVNADDSVTMFLQPRFIDATGEVVGPDGTRVPITEQVALTTQVRVPDGNTILLGGFPSARTALGAVGLPVNLRDSRTTEDLESLLFVTPHIVRFLEP